MSVLEKFHDALQDGDTGRAVELIGELDEEFDDLSERERPRKRVAQAIAEQSSNGSEAAKIAKKYNDEAGNAQKLRLELGYYLLALVEGEETGPEDVLNKTESLINTQQELDEQEQELESVKTDVDVPPQLYLTGPNSIEARAGGSTSAELIVENVGGEKAQNVTVSSASSFVDLSPTAVGTVEPDESRTIEAVIQDVPDESQEVSIKADGENTTSSHSMQMLAADESAYLERAISQLTDLRETAEDKTGVESIDDPEAVPPIETVEDLLRAVVLSKEAVETLQQQVNQGSIAEQSIARETVVPLFLLSEFVSQTVELEGEGIGPTAAGTIRQDARGVIHTLGNVVLQPDATKVLEYVDQTGTVQTSGLRNASEDWKRGDTDTELLEIVVELWESEGPIHS